jgi:dGTPase
LADESAYNAHDLDDGLRAGLFTVDDLDELVIWQELKERVRWRNGRVFDPIIRHEIIRELIGMSVNDILHNTAETIRAFQLDSPDKIQNHHENVVDYSPEFGIKIRQLKKFLLENMYRHYRLMRMQTKAERFVTALFEAYVNEPRMLPKETQKHLENRELHRVVADYIAGMTDRYALQEWERLFDPYHRA